MQEDRLREAVFAGCLKYHKAYLQARLGPDRGDETKPSTEQYFIRFDTLLRVIEASNLMVEYTAYREEHGGGFGRKEG